MKLNSFASAALASGLLLSPPLLADACDDVVQDTVAEMRAGASDWWNADIESLVRAAAGSACVKAVSGRYVAVPAQSAAEVVKAATPVSESAQAVKADAEDGSWSMGGLTFRSMSGSPGKKSYHRARENDN
ncbi:MAG: hypothetical protein ACI87W_000310 [Halieaceae bacterium]|jgi:hypothetical protein